MGRVRWKRKREREREGYFIMGFGFDCAHGLNLLGLVVRTQRTIG